MHGTLPATAGSVRFTIRPSLHNMRYDNMARFYTDSDVAPTTLPKFLLIVAEGAWAYDDINEFLDAKLQFNANGIGYKAVRAC